MNLRARNISFAIAILAIAGLAAYYFIDRVPFEQQKPAVGDSAPQIALADIRGSMVSMSDLKGRVVLVNFWAGWCPPCKSEMPGFQKVLMEFEDKGFAVLAIALDDISPSMLKELGITFPVMKINDRVKKEYGNISDVPQSFLVGKDNRIIRKVWKVYPEDELRRDVEKALSDQK
jgi:thiol-disulfide isomerase/thioredoxin